RLLKELAQPVGRKVCLVRLSRQLRCRFQVRAVEKGVQVVGRPAAVTLRDADGERVVVNQVLQGQPRGVGVEHRNAAPGDRLKEAAAVESSAARAEDETGAA